MNKVTPDELKVKMEKDVTFHLIDLRDHRQYKHNHIPGATSVPFDEHFESTIQDVVSDKGIELIGYFDGEPRCEEVDERLKALGYTNFHCLDGGIRAWMEKGYRLEFGEES